jgi:hypothetical protein
LKQKICNIEWVSGVEEIVQRDHTQKSIKGKSNKCGQTMSSEQLEKPKPKQKATVIDEEQFDPRQMDNELLARARHRAYLMSQSDPYGMDYPISFATTPQASNNGNEELYASVERTLARHRASLSAESVNSDDSASTAEVWSMRLI